MESAPYDDLGYATLTLDTPEELEALPACTSPL